MPDIDPAVQEQRNQVTIDSLKAENDFLEANALEWPIERAVKELVKDILQVQPTINSERWAVKSGACTVL